MVSTTPRASSSDWWDAIRWNLPLAPVALFTAFGWLFLRNPRVYPPHYLTGTAELDEGWKRIRAEYEAVVASGAEIPRFHELDPGQARLSASGRWGTLALWYCGHESVENTELFPETTKLLRNIPGLYSAMFSVFEPGMALPWHTGALKNILRHLLPIVVPDGPVILQVGRERIGWVEGESLTFDDTYPHRAWNDTDEARVMLFLDVERPMPWPWLTRLNRWVLRRLGETDRLRHAAEVSAIRPPGG